MIENSEMSIAEQQPLTFLRKTSQNASYPASPLRYAKVTQIQAYQRISDHQNTKFELNNPSLFKSTNIFSQHFVSQPKRMYFVNADKQQQVDGFVLRQDRSLTVKIPIRNVQRQNIIKFQVSSIKRNRLFCIQKCDQMGGRVIGFKFVFSFTESVLNMKVMLQLQGQMKVWKEMQVPMIHQHLLIEIHEFSNNQIDVRLNDYTFHLLLHTPYHSDAYYKMHHNNALTIDKIQIQSMSEGILREDEINCSKQCQLI